MSKEEKLKAVALGMATAGMNTFELDSSSSDSSDDSSQRLENCAEVVVPRSWLGLEQSASASAHLFLVRCAGNVTIVQTC